MKYPVFLQALALTIVVFLIGMYSGVILEENRLTQMNEYFVDSEVLLLDIMAQDNLVDSLNVSCESLQQSNSKLLDEVYNQAIILEDYENSGRMTKNLEALHRKYDALRSYLWINSIKIKQKCGNDFNTIVYFYNYNETDLTKKAEQNVWSKVLYEIKFEKQFDVVLIPIAADTSLDSLSILLKEYNITTYPSILVNEEFTFSELTKKEEVIKVLN
ncbi:MAG: hypothetical protein PF542_01820 [Nanoarchaeota archaeon]|jgi:hypothetical protein|nr:hypothetical protein [Nanoarchaeota archaeon]